MSKRNFSILAALFFSLALAVYFVLPMVSDASDKSKKKAVESADAPKTGAPYSQGIIAGDFVFLAGQIGTDPKTGNLTEGIEAQTEQALKNLEAVLKESKSDLHNVVKTTIFLADINDFAKVNEIYGKYMPQPFPARSTVQVEKLPRDARIEIEAVALIKK